MKIKFGLWSILILGLVVRIFLYKFGTYEWDFGTFVAWGTTIVEKGFLNFYQNTWSDYLPGYLYILALLGHVQKLFVVDQLFLYKFPAILADILTSYFIFQILKKEKGETWAKLGAIFYILNPAILINSTLWGQVDSITSLLSIMSIYYLEKNIFLSGFALSFGTLFKPQVAFISPLILVLMIKNKWKFNKILTYVLFSFVIFVLGFFPFRENQSFASFVIERLTTSANQYPYSSVNAFNFWGLWGFWKRDNVGFLNAKLLGYFFSSIFSLVFLKEIFSKKRDNAKTFGAAAGIFLSTFLFLTRIHERHLLPVFAPLLIFSITQISSMLVYLGLSVTYAMNLVYAYTYATADHSFVISELSIKFIILFNILLFGLFIFSFLKRNGRFENFLLGLKIGTDDVVLKFKKDITKDRAKKYLFLIISFAFLGRIVFLDSPKTEYFDEVYHAFTARVMLHGDPKAWEWWNTPPQGFAYEWTHPPLAKLGMVVGMNVFGENSFGWRIPGAILGTGCVFLIYLISRRIFNDRLMGLLSSFVFALEGLPLVLSRIGMNDSYFLFFALLCFYMYLKDKNFWAAIAFGLSASSKWSAIWLIPVIFVSHFVLKRKIKLSYLWFIVIPPLIYLASYIPMFLSGHAWKDFLEVQRQMWWYHTHLKATHSYTSQWWSWPINLRPVYLYTSDEVGGMVSRIYAFGNPIVSIFTVFSVFVAVYDAFVLKSKKLGLVIFSYLVFFVPWAVSPRIMFYYHYLPSIVFGSIIVAYILRIHKQLRMPVFVLFVLSFLYFFPHWTGIQVPLWLDKSYYWFRSWR